MIILILIIVVYLIDEAWHIDPESFGEVVGQVKEIILIIILDHILSLGRSITSHSRNVWCDRDQCTTLDFPAINLCFNV